MDIIESVQSSRGNASQIELARSQIIVLKMESFQQYWAEVMEIREVRWIVMIAGLVVCVCVAFYFAKLFRDMALGKSEDPTSFITEFQKLREEGKLDEEEYSRLQKAIPKQIPGKLTGQKNDTN